MTKEWVILQQRGDGWEEFYRTTRGADAYRLMDSLAQIDYRPDPPSVFRLVEPDSTEEHADAA